MTQKIPRRPHQFEEVRPPNPWPIAIAVSLAIQAIIVLELLLPYRSHLADHPERPPMRPTGVYQDAGAAALPTPRPAITLQDAGAAPSPTPSAPIDTLPMLPTRLNTTEPAPIRNPRIAPAASNPAEPRAAGVPVTPAKPGRLPAKTSAEQARVVEPSSSRNSPERTGGDPAFDTVGDWFKAMSRMRHGDFAPRRQE